MVVEDSVVNWVIGATAVGIPAIGGGIVYMWKTLVAFLAPKITEAFESHTNLVKAMETNVPVVSATMQAISENMVALNATQVTQCQTLELHSKLHAQHGEKLATIMQKLG